MCKAISKLGMEEIHNGKRTLGRHRTGRGLEKSARKGGKKWAYNFLA